MPKINGYEFVERLKTDEMYMDIPIIVISATNSETAFKKLKNYSVEAYIQKDNFNQTAFVEKIKEVLTKYHT